MQLTGIHCIIDFVLFKVFLPEDKIQKILDLSFYILKQEKVQIRCLAQLIGLYSSAHYAIIWAHLFHRYLDIDRTLALCRENNNFNHYTNLSENGKSEIQWWLDNIKRVNGKPIRFDDPTYYLDTDASNHGWGAVLD